MRAEEREKYLLQSRLRSFTRRVEEAKGLVRAALETVPGTWAVSCSGGKDSTVLLGVAIEAGWRGPVFHFRHPETPAENTALVHDLARCFDLEVVEAPTPGAWEVYERIGRFFDLPETPDEKAEVRRMLNGYKAASAAALEATGAVGAFWGMRAQESRQRKIIMAKKGDLYRVQDRSTWTSNPIRWWSVRDVWGFTVSRDLPCLRIYDIDDNREHVRSEVTWLAAPHLWAKGQAQKMRDQDIVTFEALCQRWPNLRDYST